MCAYRSTLGYEGMCKGSCIMSGHMGLGSKVSGYYPNKGASSRTDRGKEGDSVLHQAHANYP